MRIALLQLNSRCGQIAQNTPKIIRRIEEAKTKGASIIVTPELAVTGYFPIASMRRLDYLGRNYDALNEIAKHCNGITAIVGFMRYTQKPLHIFNSAAIIKNCNLVGFYDKRELLSPKSDAIYFETGRFTPGEHPFHMTSSGKTLWFCICNDLSKIGLDYNKIRSEVDVIVSLNAATCNQDLRTTILRRIADTSNTTLLYANMVGRDGDGESMILDTRGNVVAEATPDREEIIYHDLAV